jgi:formate hydrogenlyase subunit 3/multisubunit Na+/H+ antiporter MnhD subunit
MPGIFGTLAPQFLALLGSAAILFASVVALQQQRLKLLVAYSTVAQIGYLFFLFPLAIGTEDAWSSLAWTGGWLQVLSHAFAKAAMFMAAGLIADALGHDRIADLGGAGRVLPLTFVTFGIAGLSLMGIPPSGGFSAKWMLLLSSVMAGQWWWGVVMLVGGLLAGGYVFMVLGKAFGATGAASVRIEPVGRMRELVALALALTAILLGIVPLEPSGFLQIGRPA